MTPVEIVTLVRDISVIVVMVLLIIELLAFGLIFLKLYPPIKRAVQNIERISDVVLNIVSGPLNLINAILQIAAKGASLIPGLRKEGSRDRTGDHADGSGERTRRHQ